MKRFCPAKGKVSYRTYKKALKAADRQRSAYKTHGQAIAADCEVYRCPHCDDYHLTKSPRMVAA